MATKYYIDKTFTDENGQPDGCTLSTIDKGDFAQIVSMYKRHVQRCANGTTWTKVEKNGTAIMQQATHKPSTLYKIRIYPKI